MLAANTPFEQFFVEAQNEFLCPVSSNNYVAAQWMMPHSVIGVPAPTIDTATYHFPLSPHDVINIFNSGAFPAPGGIQAYFAQKFLLGFNTWYGVSNFSNYPVKYEAYTICARRDLDFDADYTRLLYRIAIAAYAAGSATSINTLGTTMNSQALNLFKLPAFTWDFRIKKVRKFTLNFGKEKKFYLKQKPRLYDTRNFFLQADTTPASSWANLNMTYNGFKKGAPLILFRQLASPATYVSNPVIPPTFTSETTSTTPISILHYKTVYEVKQMQNIRPQDVHNLTSDGMIALPDPTKIYVMGDQDIKSVQDAIA